MRRTLVPAVVLAVAIASGSAFPQDSARVPEKDAVTWTENGAARLRTAVVVESAGWDRVVWTQAGRRTTIDGADVVEVRWGDQPPEIDEGEAALRAGDADAAYAAFDGVLRARPTSRGWLVERGAAGLAEALLALASRDARNLEKAAHAFATAREANPKSLFLDRILGGLAETELRRGRADAALAAASDLASAGRNGGRPAWQAEGALLEARAHLAKDDVPGAVRAYDAATAIAEAKPLPADPQTARRLARAAIRAAAGRTWTDVARAEADRAAAPDARAAAAALAARWPLDPEAQAAATNAEGAILLATGDAKRALRKFRETEVLHFDVPAESARALWYQARCHERLGDAPARAAALKALAENWPESEWARRAR